MIEIKIKLLTGGKMPKRANEFASGWDVYANYDSSLNQDSYRLYPGTIVKIPLGFCMEIPEEYEAVLRPRSGLSSKGIYVALGTIDCDYRGEVSAIIANISMQTHRITVGDRIAQIVIQEVPKVNFVVVDELSDTERGDKGFGSSGV